MNERMAQTEIPIIGDLFILEKDISERFIHSGGPGGQNVNKVSSGVQLRYNPRAAQTLPWRIILKLEKIAGRRLNAQGDIIIQATQYRTQERNREAARERLIDLIVEAAKPPPRKRIPTKPSRNARKKRVDTKVKRGGIKKLRGRVRDE